MRLRRTQRHKPVVHENSDRWLLTYADLITLLLGLFVILYAMSKVDNSKYAQVVQALGGVFGEPALVSEGNSILPETNLASERKGIEERVRGAMYEDLNSNLISMSQDDRGVVVHLAEELLFPSGNATLKNSSTGSLELLASVLRTLPNQILVEGHTDDVPISTTQFPSNWHLSLARAMNTGDYLMKGLNLKPENVSIVGYAEYRPLVANTSVENRAKNRRVDIVIMSTELKN